MITVIVPVYKTEQYLNECVRSIIRQTFCNMEILLIDDGSPDHCGAMCDEWARNDNRIRVIHQKNGGLSSARNTGIDEAAGEYILFVDSDDWIDPTMVDVLYCLCHSHDAQIAECSYRNVYQDKVIEETKCSAKILTATPLQAIEGNLDWKFFKPVAWNKLYRRDVIGDIRYPVGKCHEDEFTTHQYYLTATNIAYVDISLYNYNRKREESITAVFRPSRMDCCEAFNKKVHLVWDNVQLRPLQKKMDNSYCYVFFESLMRSHQAGYQGPEVDAAVRAALADSDTLLRHGIEEIYKQCFKLLKENGTATATARWMEFKGIKQ